MHTHSFFSITAKLCRCFLLLALASINHIGSRVLSTVINPNYRPAVLLRIDVEKGPLSLMTGLSVVR